MRKYNSQKKLVIGLIIILIGVTLLPAVNAEINTSTTHTVSTQDDTYEDFNCSIRGIVTNLVFFDNSNNQRLLWNYFPIAYIRNGKVAFGWYHIDLMSGIQGRRPSKGWLKIEGSKGSYLWEKNSFQGTIEKIIEEKNFLREHYYYIGATEFTGFKIGGIWFSETFIIGYASHVKLGPYSPW